VGALGGLGGRQGALHRVDRLAGGAAGVSLGGEAGVGAE
jgi:hypothetical protein